MLHDADIREPLFDFLEETYGKIRILEERNTGRSRADVVMVTENEVIGLEIKSDADSYQRLSGQVKDYDRYYDRNFVVIGSSHARSIESHVPEYWGIITVDEVDGRPDFLIFRKPLPNPKRSLARKLSIMWRPELVHIQEIFEMPRYKAESKDFVIGKIAERTVYPPDKKGYIDPEKLATAISNELFERDYNTIGAEIRAYRKEERTRKKKSAGSVKKPTRRKKNLLNLLLG